MAIGNVIQRGGVISVFDTTGRQIAVIGVGAEGELKGYTSTTINVKRGNSIYTYNEKGTIVFTKGV